LDLAGHTASNRLPAFARRIAPVQISYLGYPNTTGLQQMDYRLTDAVCDPEDGNTAWHSEQLVRFAPTAWAYAPPADAPPVIAKPTEGEDRPVTFGCFNNFAKVSDATLQGWAGLLAAVPHSRLLLKAHGLDEEALQGQLRTRFSVHGLDPHRIDLMDRVPSRQAHLDLYSRVDVALDTYPYHGTTTTCEALWMGVPVVTLWGEHHAARVGGSLLKAINRPEWIATDWADYARIAADLAQDCELRAHLRTNLRSEMQSSPLLDHAEQAKRFGKALRDCWQDWGGKQTGEPTDPVVCGVE
jgi:predicted O-linked N-acetylglucosamine transferase (SPINDLY family)